MFPTFPSWAEAAGLLVGAAIAGLVVHAVLFRLLRRLAALERMPRLTAALDAAYQPLRVVVVPLALLAALPAVALPPQVDEAAARVLGILLVAAVGWALVRMTDAAFVVLLANTVKAGESDVETRRRRTQLNLFRRLTALTIGLITGGLVLTAIPAVRSIGLSLFASAGVAGIVVGIAARPMMENLIAGVQIAITQPIRIGDVVVVEGEWGHVEEISSTYVVIEVWDLRRLVVPLSYFLEKPFQNWTRLSTEIIQPVTLYVDYTVPVEALREALHDILKASPLWDGRVWNLQVTDLKERTMELRALVSATDAGRVWDLRCLVRERLLAFMQERFPEALPRTRIELAPPIPADATQPDAAAVPRRREAG